MGEKEEKGGGGGRRGGRGRRGKGGEKNYKFYAMMMNDITTRTTMYPQATRVVEGAYEHASIQLEV